MIDDLTPKFPVPAAEQEITIPVPFAADTTAQTVGGFMASPSSLTAGNVTYNSLAEQILIGQATATLTGIGVFIGNAGDGTYDFRAGDPSGNYIQWDASAATLTITGTITATAGTIGGFSIGADYIRDAANSFGLASTVTGGDDVRFWAGDTFANRATAPFRVTEAGAVAASSITITAGSVAGSTITAASLAGSQIQSATIAGSNIASATITGSNIATGTITSGNIQDATITGTGIAAATITGSNIGSATISGSNIASATIAAANIVSGTITTTQIASATILAGNIANGTITTTQISGSAGIVGGQIASATIAGGNIAATTITAGNITALTITAAQIANLTITSGKVNTALMSYSHNLAFSVASSTQVNWASGTITTSDGTSYSISSGNTGTMSAKNYIYLDTATSTTVLQKTTTFSTATGDGKMLIAVAQNNTTEAVFQVFNGIGGMNLAGGDIVAGSITSNEIAATTITASNIAANTITASQIAAATITGTQIAASTITSGLISVTQLSAIAADMGTITAGTINLSSSSANIHSGQTAYNTGTGFWLEYNSGTPRFSIGNATGDNLTWDGSTLNIIGGQKTSVRLPATESITSGNAVAAALYQSTPIVYDTKGIKRLSLSASGGTGTISLTIGANSNRALVVMMVDSGTADHTSDISADWNGTSISLTRASGNHATYVGVLVAPTTGAHTLTITNNEGASTRDVIVAAYSVYNVTQTSPLSVSSFAHGSGGTVTNSITTASDGEAVFGLVGATNGGSFTPTVGTIYESDTQGDDVDGSPQGYSGHGSFTTINPLSTSLTLAATGIGVNTWGIALVSVKPANTPAAGIQQASSAASNSRINFIGFAQASASAGTTIEVAVGGLVSNLSSIQSGSLYYLNNTNGTIGTSAGSVTRKVGIGISNSKLLITNIW